MVTASRRLHTWSLESFTPKAFLEPRAVSMAISSGGSCSCSVDEEARTLVLDVALASRAIKPQSRGHELHQMFRKKLQDLPTCSW